MSLNYLEINRILEELPLEGSFLQNIRQCSYSQLVFEFRSPGRSFSMLISLDRKTLRLHEIQDRPPSLPKPPRFTAFLRSRIKGARVTAACQIGNDRIVQLKLSKGDREDILYIRLWGGAANLILCDKKDIILDAFSRRPARGEQIGMPYVPEMDQKTPSKKFEARPLPEGCESYNRFIEQLYGELEKNDSFQLLQEKVKRSLNYKENSLRHKLESLEKRLSEYDEESLLKEKGDLLMASLHRIQGGEKEFLVHPDEAIGSFSGTIILDPAKSPVENAQDYYKKAGKASRGRNRTREETDNIRQRLEQTVQELQRLESCETEEELSALLPEEQEIRSAPKEEGPGLRFTSGGFQLIVGRSAKENETLLRRYVRGNDYWLHTRDYPGAYVFIRLPKGKSIPLDTLLDAGNLALFYSKAKTAGAADLYYTQVKYLKKPKNGKPGLVLPTREKNLYVKQDQERIARLKGQTK